MGATQAGAILGTPAYMSPEQARGNAVDRRTDTWAFGAVLYEMLTGRQAFAGDTVTDMLAAVIHRDPDWTGVPETLRPLLRRCLEKDPKRRLREPSDGMLLLEPGTQPPAATGRRFGLISTAAAAVFLLAFAVLSLVHFREKPRAAEMVRLQFSLPPNVTFSRSGIFAISPDGRKVAFSAFGADGVPRIWIRDLASPAARPLANLQTPLGLYALFWSPDSRFLGSAVRRKAEEGRCGKWRRTGDLRRARSGFRRFLEPGRCDPVWKRAGRRHHARAGDRRHSRACGDIERKKSISSRSIPCSCRIAAIFCIRAVLAKIREQSISVR